MRRRTTAAVPAWAVLYGLSVLAVACWLAAAGLPVLAAGLVVVEVAVGALVLAARRGGGPAGRG